MSKITTEDKKKEESTWSTWEELLLAFAVKRHGLKDWDSVAMELRSRSSSSDLLTAEVCRDKYCDLHRRFMNSDELAKGLNTDGESGGAVDIPWLDKLRQLRVLQLKQEVHRYDLSIQSLQLKVKRMEEERDHSLKESQNDAVKPDLEEDKKENRSEKDEKNSDSEPPEKASGKSVSVEESDHENRSFNESNTTENRGTEEKPGPASIEGGEVKPDPETKPVRKEDSCNDSSDRREESNQTRDRKSKKELATEKRDFLGASKESRDVQSTASLTKKRRKRADVNDAGGDGGNVAAAAVSPAIAKKRESAVKSEPFVGLLVTIRSRKNASVFERRLDIQKTERYKSIIRRHVDLGRVEARIDDGSYSGCPMSFYLDLLVLFNNAMVFFPNTSPEWTAAQQLRGIVIKELQKHRPEPPYTKVEPESSAHIVVCSRKRSSLSANKQENEKPPINPKPKTTVKTSSSTREDESSEKLKPNVTGVRSMRRRNPPQSTTTKKPAGAPLPKMEESFLKRIKKSTSPDSTSRRVQLKRKATNERKEAKPENSPSKRSVGRHPKRSYREGGKESNSNSNSKEGSSKRPHKRSTR